MIALTLATGATCLMLATTATGLVWGAVHLARTPRTEKE